MAMRKRKTVAKRRLVNPTHGNTLRPTNVSKSMLIQQILLAHRLKDNPPAMKFDGRTLSYDMDSQERHDYSMARWYIRDKSEWLYKLLVVLKVI